MSTTILRDCSKNIPHFVADSSVSPQGLKWAIDPVADVVTTAGDLLYATAADTVTRLGIGTAGQVLKVNSGATAPEWGAAGGATYVGVAAYANNVNQSISDLTATAITYPSEEYDTDGFHSTSTNTSRITIPSGKGGKYQITAGVSISATTNVLQLRVYKNGSVISGIGQDVGIIAVSFASSDRAFGTMTVDAVATDYFEIFVIHSSSGSSRDVRYSRFSMDYLGA